MAKKTIAFEIGTEELPAIELHEARLQVENICCNQKGKLFEYDDVQIYDTPRRIIVVINGVEDKIEAKDEEYKGPKLEIAYKDGNPTNAAIGFARGKGVGVEDLIQKDGCVYVVKHIPEKNVIDMLPDLFLGLIKSISWKKAQRWGSVDEEFARPIRWIFAMFGSDVINIEYAGVKSSNYTFGHRFLAPDKIDCSSADNLLGNLSSAYVVVSEDERESIIRKQVAEIEESNNLVAQLPESIMREVINLCEYPTCMVGKFDELFLAVPKEIIVDAMLVHQRYFPLFDKDGNLTNNFIIISNGNPKCQDTIVDGNQRVVDARLYDAKFFFDEDKKKPLESYVENLKDVVFQEELGTMQQKAKRISDLSGFIAKAAKLNDSEIDKASRAGLLAKADLVTNAVVEFTSVQGIMGYYYALSSNEDEDVAIAIKEHYMPKFSGDDVPKSGVSKAVALADKIDTLCGMFAIDLTPTGSSDPFALRRGAIGIVSIMQDNFDFSLCEAVDYSLEMYKQQGIDFNKDDVFNNILDFIITRTKVILKDSGIEHDSIDAVSSVKVFEPLMFISRAKALDNARKNNHEVFEDLATAFARANNLRKHELGKSYNESLFDKTETSLADAIKKAQINIDKLLKTNNYEDALSELAGLKDPIDKFFEDVMIMDKNIELQENRLKLLNSFVDVFANIADFSKMAKREKK